MVGWPYFPPYFLGCGGWARASSEAPSEGRSRGLRVEDGLNHHISPWELRAKATFRCSPQFPSGATSVKLLTDLSDWSRECREDDEGGDDNSLRDLNHVEVREGDGWMGVWVCAINAWEVGRVRPAEEPMSKAGPLIYCSLQPKHPAQPQPCWSWRRITRKTSTSALSFTCPVSVREVWHPSRSRNGSEGDLPPWRWNKRRARETKKAMNTWNALKIRWYVPAQGVSTRTTKAKLLVTFWSVYLKSLQRVGVCTRLNACILLLHAAADDVTRFI